jgi:hypothetical protein
VASNTPAPEDTFDGFQAFGAPAAAGSDDDATTWGEWNPTEESLRQQSRSGGRHRVVKQRSGFARSSTVLGVGVIAAVGAGGMATAQDKPAVSISLPDLNLPDASELPGVGELLSDGGEDAQETGSGTNNPQPLTASLTVPADADAATQADGGSASEATADAGEALRARILQQAEQQQASADAAAKAEAERLAVEKAAAEAAVKADAAEKAAAEAKRKAEEEAAAKAEAERLAKLAASYALPTSSYTLTSTYGQSGSMWSHRPRLRGAHRHPGQGGARRHHHLGGLVRLLRLPDRPGAGGRFGGLVRAPVLDDGERGPVRRHRRDHRARRRDRQRDRPAPAPGGPHLGWRRHRPGGLVARQGPVGLSRGRPPEGS